jgi:hypothetical protein
MDVSVYWRFGFWVSGFLGPVCGEAARHKSVMAIHDSATASWKELVPQLGDDAENRIRAFRAVTLGVKRLLFCFFFAQTQRDEL